MWYPHVESIKWLCAERAKIVRHRLNTELYLETAIRAKASLKLLQVVEISGTL